MQWTKLTPARGFWLSLASLLVLRFTFALRSLQYHVDGDMTVSLLQANDWLATPQRSYFWAQDYMGTTEVWLLSSLWRALFGLDAKVPLSYWVFCSQLLFCTGVALVYSGLVRTDAEFWSRARTFVLYQVVFGFGVPAFQKFTFGVGHGYSSVPLYAGVTIACYLFRERLHIAVFLLAGLLLGQSHFIFRMHVLYPVALALTLIWSGPKHYALKVLALALGVVVGMLPEKLLFPPQGYSPSVCLQDPLHGLENVWQAVRQTAVQFGTLPYSLLESEHALWFANHRPLSEDWIRWGEWIGAAWLLVLFAIDLRRSLRSPKYRIFGVILAINLAALATSCLTLDLYGGRRYMYLSLFSVPFLMMSPPWTGLHRAAMFLRTAALAVYVVSAVNFRTPLATFSKRSAAQQFDERYDCLAGHGHELSPLIALNGLRVRTIDLDWRLRSNYSRNVDATAAAVRDNCRQVFLIAATKKSNGPIRKLCKLEPPYFSASPRGIVDYPQQLEFSRCRVPGHDLPAAEH